jgi:hypothetical protein
VKTLYHLWGDVLRAAHQALIRRRRYVANALSAALVGAAVLYAAPAHAATRLIDNFEAADAFATWRFNNGSEFPGATGSMAAVAGHPGRGLSLTYDFSRGGLYVAALRSFPPVTAVAIRLSARVPEDAVLGVRVRDATGQWLVYQVQRALAPLGGGAWFRTVVELGRTDSYWSGANDGIVHGAIDSLWVTVGSSGLQKQGSVAVDQIEVLDTLDTSIDLTRVAVAPSPFEARSLMNGLGVAIHSLTDAKGLDVVKHSGLKWVRTHLTWSYVERTRGVYDWSQFDGLLRLLDARGLRVLFILAYSNPLYGGGPPVSAEASAAFAAYAKAAAQHYAGRGVHFEVWNEPDAGFWEPTDPVAYARVAKLAIDAVHAGNPGAQVSTGGLSWFDLDYLNAALQAGVGARADAIGIHPYRKVAPPESVADDVPRARALIARIGRSPPLWDTEWGYSTLQFGPANSADARRRQAAMAVRRMVSARLVGFPLALWYNTRDDATLAHDSPHNQFGLLGADGSEKPVLLALRTLGGTARTRTLAGVLEVGQPLLNGVRFDGASDAIWMIWSATPNRAIRINVPRPSRAVNMLGTPLSVGTTYTLQESNGPIYLVYPRTSAGITVGTVNTARLQPNNGFGSNFGCRVTNNRSGHQPVVLGVSFLVALLALRRRPRPVS